MNIGENIKRFRTALKMEQKELAEKLHVSDKTVSSWECGRTEPKMGMIEDMAQIFNITKSELIEPSPTFNIPWTGRGAKYNIIVTEEENNLINAYRIADDLDRRAVQKILGIDNNVKKDSLDA